MQIYLTGATGYLGMNLLYNLIKSQDVGEIRLLVRNIDSLKNLMEAISNNEDSIKKAIKDKITYQVGSLPDTELDLSGINCIVHAAALRGPAIKKRGYKGLVDVNIFGTRQVVSSVKQYKCQKTIFISSQSVYLNNPNLPWKESAIPAPADLYSATKYAGEELIKELAIEGLQYVIIRASHLYGHGFNMRKNELESIFAQRVIESKPLYIFGDGKRRLDFCHVQDIITATCKIIFGSGDEIWNQVYNIGQGDPLTIYEIANIFREAAEKLQLKPVEIIFAKQEHEDSYPVLWLDISKAKELLNWEPRVSLQQGIEELLKQRIKTG